MNLTTLQNFRQEICHCFERERDALFNSVDALISESQAQSFPELSLSPFFPRGWSSLYKAFKRGRINRKRLQDSFIKYIPNLEKEKRLILGIDATSIERPFSRTSPERTAIPLHNIPHSSGTKKSTPITFGWKYSTVTVLPEEPSSWTYLVDQQRIPSDKTDIQVACEQLKEIVPKLRKRPLILLDRGYVCVWLWCQLSSMALDALVRLKSNQCFYKPAPPHTGQKGAPRKDGAKLKLDNPSTQSHPDQIYEVTDEKGHAVSIRCWKQMHVKEARWLNLTIIQVSRPHASDKERDPRISWFVYIGQDTHDAIAQIALLYCLRFSQEHGYRFDKQSLLWTELRVQTPEQFDLWSHIVAIAHNHIVIARDFVEGELRPWENKQRKYTPQQVRRGLAKFLSLLGTPARPSKPRGKSNGRDIGITLAKRTRFPVVRKKPSLPQIVST
jgi:hypothetical protein